MSKEQYGKILGEIKIPNVTTTREDIIRVREAMIGLYGPGHNPKSPIILDPMNLRNSAEKNVMFQLYLAVSSRQWNTHPIKGSMKPISKEQ